MILEGLLYRLMPCMLGLTGGMVAASTTWPMSALSSPGQPVAILQIAERRKWLAQ